MHTIKITPNLLLAYQCTSGKFIRSPNQIEKIDSVAKIEPNRMETFFCPNWNALVRIVKSELGVQWQGKLGGFPPTPWVQYEQ